jgi:hypothetical protein
VTADLAVPRDRTLMPSACILADSLAPTGERLVTATVRMPLIVWQELLTHRTMSRGSGSSRAVPLLKRKAEALADPFIPDAFPINGPGMSPARYTVPGTDEHAAAVAWWLRARDHAVDSARDSITLSGVDDHGDLRLDVHKESPTGCCTRSWRPTASCQPPSGATSTPCA